MEEEKSSITNESSSQKEPSLANKKEFEFSLDSQKFLFSIGRTEDNKIFIIKAVSKTVYYLLEYSLEQFQEIDKYFKQYDTLEEINDLILDIFENKDILIKNTNKSLIIVLKIVGRKTKEIELTLKEKKRQKVEIMNSKIIELENNLKLLKDSNEKEIKSFEEKFKQKNDQMEKEIESIKEMLKQEKEKNEKDIQSIKDSFNLEKDKKTKKINELKEELRQEKEKNVLMNQEIQTIKEETKKNKENNEKKNKEIQAFREEISICKKIINELKEEVKLITEKEEAQKKLKSSNSIKKNDKSFFLKEELEDPEFYANINSLRVLQFLLDKLEKKREKIEGRTPKDLMTKICEIKCKINVLNDSFRDENGPNDYLAILETSYDYDKKLAKYFSQNNEEGKLIIVLERLPILLKEIKELKEYIKNH